MANQSSSATTLQINDLSKQIEKPLRKLTYNELEAFKNDGVACLKQVLPTKWVNELSIAVNALAKKRGGGGDKLTASAAFSWLGNDDYAKIVYNCPTAHIGQEILNHISDKNEGENKPVNFFYDQTFVKFPGKKEAILNASNVSTQIPEGTLKYEGNTPLHQDITFWPVKGKEIVSLWIPLDPIGIDNGALEFVPGSQKTKKLYKAYGVEGIEFPSGSLEDLPNLKLVTHGYKLEDATDGIYFDVVPGDIIAFDTTILHGAPANFNPTAPRRAIALRYCGKDVVLDNLKYGFDTVFSPFDVFDTEKTNGSRTTGFVYPQVLPNKNMIEIKKRVDSYIKADPTLMQKWATRMNKINEKIKANMNMFVKNESAKL